MSQFINKSNSTHRSKVVLTDRSKEMIAAMQGVVKPTATPFDGQFGQRAVITISKPKGYGTGSYVFDSADYDFEFDIPFSYNLEPKKAEIIIYNIPKTGVTLFANTSINVSAGYGDNIKRIFSGTIKSAKTKRDDLDRVTTIKADSYTGISNPYMNQTYTNNAKASYILKDLIKVTKKPLFKFSTTRDYVYTDDETVEGDLLSNIDRIAAICGSIVFDAGGIYVCPYTFFRSYKPDGIVSYLNGLIDVNEWADTERNGKFTDYTHGYEVTMLLNPKIGGLTVFSVNMSETESGIIYNNNKNIGTKLIALSGSHEYDGEKMITKVKGVV